MADALQWIQANWMLIVGTGSAVVTGSSLILKAVAPLTKNKADDKAVSFLDKVLLFLNKIALNPPVK